MPKKHTLILILLVLFFGLTVSAQNEQEEPEYFRLLEAERPNIIEIRNAYLKYYETFEHTETL